MYQALSAGELCTRETVYVLRDTPVTEAARLMREHHVGSLVVVDESERGRLPVGMLTDRDIVTAVVAKAVDARTLAVGDLMTGRAPATVHDGASVLDALAVMRRAGVRRVPVTDTRGALVGVLALDDVLDIVEETLGAIVGAIDSGRRHEREVRP